MKMYYSERDFKLSEKYVGLALAMDELYRKSVSDDEASFSAEGILPVILNKADKASEESWADIKASLTELYKDYRTIENDVRRNYISEQITSVLALGEWIFEKKECGYRNLVQNILQVNPNPITENQRKLLHKKLDILLTDKNYRGSLEKKVQDWRKDHLVEKYSMKSVLRELISEAKEQSLEFGIKEIQDLDIEAKVIYNAAYNGYIDFENRVMEINGDLEYAYEDLKHLVTHETFPGHMAHMEIRRQRVEAGEIPLDAALVFTNTASSSIFEGIADNAARFLEWDKSTDDQVSSLLQIIKSTASYGAAHMLHEEKRDLDAVKQYFRDYAFLSESAIDSRIRFISHPLRQAFIYSYWRGNEAVYKAYKNVTREQFPKFCNYLYGNMHSANTVGQFNNII